MVVWMKETRTTQLLQFATLVGSQNCECDRQTMMVLIIKLSRMIKTTKTSDKYFVRAARAVDSRKKSLQCASLCA